MAQLNNSVITKKVLNANNIALWDNLLFYEKTQRKIPLYLKLILPIPIGTNGEVYEAGDTTMCIYTKGYLHKELTKIEYASLYEFRIVEQTLYIKFGIRLMGGCYVLRKINEHQTEISVKTNYVGSASPRWLLKPFEKMVCHQFHKFLLKSIIYNSQLS